MYVSSACLEYITVITGSAVVQCILFSHHCVSLQYPSEALKLLFLFLHPLQWQDSPLWKWWAGFLGLFLGDIPLGPNGTVPGGWEEMLPWQKAESALQLQDLETQQNDRQLLLYLCWQCKKKLALV